MSMAHSGNLGPPEGRLPALRLVPTAPSQLRMLDADVAHFGQQRNQMNAVEAQDASALAVKSLPGQGSVPKVMGHEAPLDPRARAIGCSKRRPEDWMPIGVQQRISDADMAVACEPQRLCCLVGRHGDWLLQHQLADVCSGNCTRCCRRLQRGRQGDHGTGNATASAAS